MRVRFFFISALFAILVSGCATTQSDRPGYIKAGFSSTYTWKSGLSHPNFPHIYSAAEVDHWNADSGYTFISKDSLAVQWTSGQKHRNFPHIHSAAKEGSWVADDGYQWVNDIKDDFAVEWKPNLNHSKYKNIYSTSQEGYWNAAPGYQFISKGDLKVEWEPGQKASYAPKVYASGRERYWVAEPGYRFIRTKESTAKYSDSLRVEWAENMGHPTCTFIKSSNEQGRWNAVDGYRFVKGGENLSVVKEPPNRLLDIFAKIGFVLWGADASLPAPGDGLLTRWGKSVIKEASRKATESAMDDIQVSLKKSDAGEVIPCNFWEFL